MTAPALRACTAAPPRRAECELEPITRFWEMTSEEERLFAQTFGRAFRFWKRWDEAIWRFEELRAVAQTLREHPYLGRGPILDVGCGDGDVFGCLFGPRSDAYGVDPSVTFDTDAQRAAASGWYREVRREDARNLSFDNGVFALVFANSVVEHVAPIEPLLAEAHRVLGPGGTLMFTTPDPALYSRDAYYWRHRLSRIGCDFIGRGLARRECAVYKHVTVLPFAEWRSHLEAAGFETIERIGYLPREMARVLTRFGALTRLGPLAWTSRWLSPEERRLSRAAATEGAWVQECHRLFGASSPPHDDGCGQLILARKPQ